ncbi:hypothetical protein [Streptomyces avermitilis]|uniref:hypothetical protein n=1 Tax=Streptomyces avermitilis TaxID=33903 RepID=UPI00367DA037
MGVRPAAGHGPVRRGNRARTHATRGGTPVHVVYGRRDDDFLDHRARGPSR